MSKNISATASFDGITGEPGTPATQQAIVQVAYGGTEVLRMQAVPVLDPGPEQVLIRIYAAALNPTDWYMRRDEPGYTSVPVPVVPGGDVAGVVERVGPGVTLFKKGDPVFAVISRSGNNGVRLNGGYSQYVVADLSNVLRKPESTTFVEAAGLALAPITGVRAVTALGVKKGERLLVAGASGSVGSTAAIAAKARGAYVIGTALPQQADYLRSIGVDEVHDFQQERYEDGIAEVDAVLDTIGAMTTPRVMSTLRRGGRFHSTARADIDELCLAAGVVYVPRSPAHGQGRAILDEVSALADSGKLRVRVDRTYPWTEAAEAQTYGESGKATGKIVLVVDKIEANTR